MSTSNRPELGIDDERFAGLFLSIEQLLATFFTEILAEEQGDEIGEHTDEDKDYIETESEVAMGYLGVVLAALDARILSTSKTKDDEDAYEIKLTVPKGDLGELMRQVMQNLDSDDFD